MAQDLDALRHTAAHVMAAAVLELWPEAKLTLGPPTPDGFYYDFDLPETVSEKDLEKIEGKMREILPAWTEFTHREVSADEAKEFYKDNPYKLDLIDEIIKRGEPITLYTCGRFTDLCRGGHVENPAKELKHFKLLSVAGAYWRGDEKNAMLTRIYGTAFANKEELKEFLTMREEAKKRDHRKLGKELDLFTISPLVGSGLPLFTPKGTAIRDALENFVWTLQRRRGYAKVSIPHLAKPELYRTSGHWDKFADNLFHVKGKSGEEFVVKPMNCPHHTQIYASRPRSYKELPLRLAEVTTVYRDEQAGELLGLARVRSITQDDAHVFCRADQLETEIGTVMDIINDFYKAFDFELKIRLSLRDPKNSEAYLGTREIWEQAEGALREALNARSLPFEEKEGEAAFYGPKIDFTAIDSLKRSWQLATVQLDFNMPARFKLTYTDENGKDAAPVMIHRAITGSLERFMAILLEHYAGALPAWLSPVQVAVLPISDDQNTYAEKIAEELQVSGVRVEVDERSESIGKKIRESQLQKIPYMLVVGKKEVADGTVAVRSRDKGDEGAKSLTDFVEAAKKDLAPGV